MKNRAFKYLCSLLIMLLALIPFILVLPIYAFRFFVGSILVNCYSTVDKLLTTRSSIFGVDDIYKKPRSTIVATLVVEGTVNLEKARDVAESRLIQQRDINGTLKKPELQQFVAPFWGFLAWKWDFDFDVRNHIRMYNGRFQPYFTDGTKPVNSATMVEVSEELISAPFCSKRSPWVVHIIHNYSDTDPVSGCQVGLPQTALMLQAHHSLGDGFSLLRAFVYDLTVGEDVTAVLSSHSSRPKGQHGFPGIGSAFDRVFSAPYELVYDLWTSTDVNSWHVPKKQLERKMNGAISHMIPMDYIKEIKALHKVSFTALILECFTAAIRRFMMEAGFDVPSVIHCGSMLPAPEHPDKMRNHMTGCIIKLPVGLPDALKRFQAIEKNVNQVMQSSVPITGFYMAPFIGGLFRWMLPGLVQNNIVTAMMSNVPGPQNVLTVMGHKLMTMSFSVGLYKGTVGMSFNALSYNGTMRIMAGVDNGIVPKCKLPADKLIQYFLDEMEMLKLQLGIVSTDDTRENLNIKKLL